VITTDTGRPTPASVNFGDVYTGLTTIVYRLVNPDGTLTPAPAQDWTLATGANLVEVGDGIYMITLTFLDPWTGLIEWDTALGAGNVESEEVLVGGASLTADHVPTVAEIGTLLRARTKDLTGNELGTFTTATRPTDTEVSALIAQATDALVDAVGVSTVTLLPQAARHVLTLEVACMIEASYFPEQLNDEQSAYLHYDTLRREKRRELQPVFVV
jgi:hypothetical protein